MQEEARRMGPISDNASALPAAATAAASVPLAAPLPPLLTYHQVRAGARRYVYAVTPDQLDAHLRWLAAGGGAGSLAIGFDDAHISVYRAAFPLLTRYGLAATIFAIAGFSNGRGGYMEWGQLREMAAAGHSIQSHSWSHPFLSQCSPQQLRQELVRSKRDIEDHLGQDVSAIAVPGGRWNPAVIAACAAAGYRRVYTSDPPGVPIVLPVNSGRAGDCSAAVEVLGRYMARRDTSVPDLAAMSAARYSRSPRQRWRRWASRRLRAALGDRLYHQLWRRFSGADQDDIAGPE